MSSFLVSHCSLSSIFIKALCRPFPNLNCQECVSMKGSMSMRRLFHYSKRYDERTFLILKEECCLDNAAMLLMPEVQTDMNFEVVM